MTQAAPMLNGLRLKVSLAFNAAPRFLWRKFQTQTVFQTKGKQDNVISRMDSVMSAIRRVPIDRSDAAGGASLSPSKRARTETAEERPVLKFAKLSEHATTPTRGSARAAGYDLYSAYDYTIGPMDKVIVKTDIQIAVPNGCYGRVAPRSGLAVKNFIDVGAGVVDEDYRGNLGVVLFNFGKETFQVKKGDRVAQLVCEKICYPDLQEQMTLDETARGAGGFGSTGSK